jgi:hypothetical protein
MSIFRNGYPQSRLSARTATMFCHSESSLRWYLDLVNRTVYLMLWVFEVLTIVGLVLALTLPIQDYALREFFQWQQHPSPETYKEFLEKQRQERVVRLMIAVPFVVTAALLPGPLMRYRRKFR